VNQVGWYISGTYMALGLSGVCLRNLFCCSSFFHHLLGRIFLLAYLYTVAVKLIIFFRAISCPLFFSNWRFFISGFWLSVFCEVIFCGFCLWIGWAFFTTLYHFIVIVVRLLFFVCSFFDAETTLFFFARSSSKSQNGKRERGEESQNGKSESGEWMEWKEICGKPGNRCVWLVQHRFTTYLLTAYLSNVGKGRQGRKNLGWWRE